MEMGVELCKSLDHFLSAVQVSSSSIKGLRRYGSSKNFNQKHPDSDADMDANVTTALPVLRTQRQTCMLMPTWG